MRRFDLRPYRAHITTNRFQIPYLCVASSCQLCSSSAHNSTCQAGKEREDAQLQQKVAGERFTGCTYSTRLGNSLVSSSRSQHTSTVSSTGNGLLAPTRALLAKRPKISIRTALDGPQCTNTETTKTGARREPSKEEAMAAGDLLEKEVHNFLEASLASSPSLPITQLASSLPDHLMESEALENGLRSFLASHPHRYCLTTTSTTGDKRILMVSQASSSSDTNRPVMHVSPSTSSSHNPSSSSSSLPETARVVGRRQKRNDTIPSGVDLTKKGKGTRAEEQEGETAEQRNSLSSSLDGVSTPYAAEYFASSSSPYSLPSTKSSNPKPFVPPPAPGLRTDKTLFSSFLVCAGAGLGEGASEANLMRAQQVHVAVPPPQSPPLSSLCNKSPKVRAASVFDEVSLTYTPTKGDNYVCDGGCGVSEVRVVPLSSSAFSSHSAGVTHRQFDVRPSAATNRLARGGVRYDAFTELQREASLAIAKVPHLRLASIQSDLIPRELWGEARLTKLRCCCWPGRSERRVKGLVETLLDIQKVNDEIPNLITVVGVESPRPHRKQYSKSSHSNSSIYGGKVDDGHDHSPPTPVGLEVLSHAQIFDFLASSIPARNIETTPDGHEKPSIEKVGTSCEPHTASNRLLLLRKRHECEAVLSHFDLYARMNPTMTSYFTTPKNEAASPDETSPSTDTMINFRRAEEYHLYRIARFVSALPRGSPISDVALRASSTHLIDPLPPTMYERLGRRDVSTSGSHSVSSISCGNPQQISSTNRDVDLESNKSCTDLTDVDAEQTLSGYTSLTFVERDHTEAEARDGPFMPFEGNKPIITNEEDLQTNATKGLSCSEEKLRSILEEGIYHDVSEDIDSNRANNLVEAEGQKTLEEEPHLGHGARPRHPDAMQIFLTAPYLFEVLGPKSGSLIPSRYTGNECDARTNEQSPQGDDLVPFQSGVENISCTSPEEPNGSPGVTCDHRPPLLLMCSRVSSVRFVASDRYLPDEYCLPPSHLQMAIDQITQNMAEAREEQREKLIQKGKKPHAKMPFDKKVIRYRGALKKLKLAQTVQKCGPSPFVDPHVTAWLIYDLCVEYLAREKAKERATSGASDSDLLSPCVKLSSEEALTVEHCEFVPKGKDAYANAADVYISTNAWDFTFDHFYERSTSTGGSPPSGISQCVFRPDYELRSRTINFNRAILPLIPAAVTSYSAISLRMLTSAAGLFEVKADGLDVLISLRDGFGCTLLDRECETCRSMRGTVRLSKGERSPMASNHSPSYSASSPLSSITAAVLGDGPKSLAMEISVHALHQVSSRRTAGSSLGSSTKGGDDDKSPASVDRRTVKDVDKGVDVATWSVSSDTHLLHGELEDGYSRFTDDEDTMEVGSIGGTKAKECRGQIDSDSYDTMSATAFGTPSCAEANGFFVDQLSKHTVSGSTPSRRLVKQCRLIFGPLSSVSTTASAGDNVKGEEYSLGVEHAAQYSVEGVNIEEERGGGERIAFAAAESPTERRLTSLLGAVTRGEIQTEVAAPPVWREEGWASVASDHLASSIHALLVVMSRGRTAMSSRSGGECSHNAWRSTLRPPAISSALSVGSSGSLFVSIYSLSVRMRYSEPLSRGLVFGQQVIFPRSGGALPIGLPHSLEHAVIEGMLVRHGDTFQIPTYAEQLALVVSGERNEKNDEEAVSGGLSVVSFLRRYPKLFQIDSTGHRVRAL